jgi:CheY-like chemotaxis protein
MNVAALSKNTKKTVLVVDDDQAICTLAKWILTTGGYQVLSAGNANDALSIARDTRQDLHLLVTDYNMPEMNGIDLVAQLRLLRPGTPAVIMTGDPAATDPVQRHAFLLCKPFNVKTLLYTVETALAARKVGITALDARHVTAAAARYAPQHGRVAVDVEKPRGSCGQGADGKGLISDDTARELKSIAAKEGFTRAIGKLLYHVQTSGGRDVREKYGRFLSDLLSAGNEMEDIFSDLLSRARQH